MEERDAKLGLATLCIGGGQGIATIIERIWLILLEAGVGIIYDELKSY